MCESQSNWIWKSINQLYGLGCGTVAAIHTTCSEKTADRFKNTLIVNTKMKWGKKNNIRTVWKRWWNVAQVCSYRLVWQQYGEEKNTTWCRYAWMGIVCTRMDSPKFVCILDKVYAKCHFHLTYYACLEIEQGAVMIATESHSKMKIMCRKEIF